MTGRRPVVAVVLAGGAGHRVGAGVPKQLLPLGDRTVLEHAVAAFLDSVDVDEVVVVTAAELVDRVGELLSGAGMTGVRVVEGGVLRSDSTRAAILALGERDCDVLFHDAARPLVDGRIIADCVAALVEGEAVTAAIACTDTVVVVDVAGDLAAVPDRDRLRRIQTPQGFRLAVIREAYRLMDADPAPELRATDDCTVVRHYLPAVPIHLVEGAERNLKITHPADLVIAAALGSGGSG